ncbi:MAG: DoxX family protein [Candidatus Sulfotelmatobacter sp.]
MILIEAILFVMPGAAHGFAQTHMPNVVRLVLGFGEIVGCILMLNPRTAIRGAWVLVVFFVLAIVIHVLHGLYEVGNLAIYAAAAWAVADGKND